MLHTQKKSKQDGSHSLSIKCKNANTIGFNEPRKRQQII